MSPRTARPVEFYAALAHQCFINEYVFFRDEEELQGAGNQRDLLIAALNDGAPIPVLRLLAVAAYFPLHSLSGAARLTDRTWPEPVIRRSGATGARATRGGAIARRHSKTDRHRGCGLAHGPDPI